MLGAIRGRGESSTSREARRRCCCARALRGFREEIDPGAAGGAYLLGLRRLGVVPHGRFTRRGLRAGDRARRAGRARGHRGRAPTRALEAADALGSCPRPRRPLACAQNERLARPTPAARWPTALGASADDPRAGVRADPRPPGRRARRRRRARSARRRASGRTSRPTRSTCTRSCRSSRTPTG